MDTNEIDESRGLIPAAETLKELRYSEGEWWSIAEGAELLARELAYQLKNLGVGLAEVQAAAQRPVSSSPAMADLVQPDLEYALAVAIDEARRQRRAHEDE